MTAAELKALRLAYGDTQERWARRVGVAVSTVYTWERGTRTPHAICQAKLERLKRKIEK